MDRSLDEINQMNANQREVAIVQGYLSAKLQVLRSQYSGELICARPCPDEISESRFLRELAWVILAAGMADRVIRAKFPGISTAFLEWESASAISCNAKECVANALLHFRHVGKIRAIASAADKLCSVPSFDVLRLQILRDPIQQLQSFAYIGPVTAFHIAKNMGFPVAKPDRHLERLARSNGFQSVEEFCEVIASYLGEDIRLVDSVLWRFATMHNDYINRFSRPRQLTDSSASFVADTSARTAACSNNPVSSPVVTH